MLIIYVNKFNRVVETANSRLLREHRSVIDTPRPFYETIGGVRGVRVIDFFRQCSPIVFVRKSVTGRMPIKCPTGKRMCVLFPVSF